MQKSQQWSILVTGANGYLGSHIVQLLLQQGLYVVGSVKDLKDQKSYEHLSNIHPEAQKRLRLIEIDLLNEQQWSSGLKGIQYVLHSAEIALNLKTVDVNSFISQSCKQIQILFEQALKNEVKKIVFAGSNGSTHIGLKLKNHFCDHDWGTVKDLRGIIERSKYFQEKEIWRLFEKHKDRIQITVLLQGLMIGPSLSSNFSRSNELLIRSMTDRLKYIPKMGFPLVDVRDVAKAHVLCIGEHCLISNAKRYMIVEGCYWLSDVIDVLRDEFEKQGYKMVKNTTFSQLFSSVHNIKPDASFDEFQGYLGRLQLCDNTTSKKELQIQYRYFRESILDSAFDYLAKGAVKIRQASAKL